MDKERKIMNKQIDSHNSQFHWSKMHSVNKWMLRLEINQNHRLLVISKVFEATIKEEKLQFKSQKLMKASSSNYNIKSILSTYWWECSSFNYWMSSAVCSSFNFLNSVSLYTNWPTLAKKIQLMKFLFQKIVQFNLPKQSSNANNINCYNLIFPIFNQHHALLLTHIEPLKFQYFLHTITHVKAWNK